MEKYEKPHIEISEFCNTHEASKITAWCTDHEIGVCELCKSNDHSVCSSVESFDKSHSFSELTTEFRSLKSHRENIKKVYETLQKERQSNIESLSIQKKKITNQLHDLVENLNQHLTDLKQNLIEELEKKCDGFTTKLQDEIADFKHRAAVLERYDDESQKTRKYGSDLQIMLAAKEETIITDVEEKRIRSLSGEVKNFSLELNISEFVNKLLYMSPMGKINTVEADTYIDTAILNKKIHQQAATFLKSPTAVEVKKESRWGRTRLKRENDFNINTSSDALFPEVTGAVFLPDDTFILSDGAQQRLIHIKEHGQEVKEIELSYFPYDVGVLGNSKLYISTPNSRRLEIRDCTTLKPVDELFLPSNASGLNGYQNKLLVVCCEKSGLYLIHENGNISVIPMRNNEQGPVDISAERICYAETRRCLVHLLTHAGGRKFSVKVDGNGYVNSVALLKDNSILVAKLNPGIHSVYHISNNGRDKMLRLELNDVSAPRTLAVNRKKRKILLVHGVRRISVYKEL